MARSHFKHVVTDKAGHSVQNAAVYVFAQGTAVIAEPPTGTAISGSMYPSVTGGSAIANPLISNDQGEVEAFLDTAQYLDVVVTDNSDGAYYPGNPSGTFPFASFIETGEAIDPTAAGGAGHTQSHDHSAAGDGTALVPESLEVTGGPFAARGDISPAQLTADQNDYSPTGLADTVVLRVSSDASRTITGLAGGADGRILVIQNIGAQNIVLADESVSSAAANRLALNAAITIRADDGVVLQYDSTSSRWRCIGHSIDTGGGGGAVATDAIWDALGDLVYGSGVDTGARLAGNTTTTKKFLRQTGDGAASAAPAWDTIADGDVPATHSGSVHHNQITPGTGLDLTGDTLDIDSSEFTAETAPQIFDDTVHVRDSSAAAERKMALVNLTNPRNTFTFANDLLFLNALTGGENVGEFEVALSGAGAAFSIVAGEVNHPGIQTASTGTTTGGGALIGMAGNALLLGGGKARMSVCLRTGPTLSAAAQRYDIQAGFWDVGFNDATDGVYLRYSDDINAGKWQLIAVSNGVSTVTDTGIAVAADTWYTLEVEVNAAGSSAEGFINGASVGTVASNIPTGAGRHTGGGVQIWKSAGTTARTMDIDMVRLALDFTTAR